MNATDNFKLRILLEEASKCLRFLDLIKVQDDISSELAGFEISKLLKDQENNEERYAQLVRRRTGLTGIVHKKGNCVAYSELEEVEAEIASVAAVLKQSTKKLCKLFKENPNLEKDSLKVSRQRRALIAKLEELMGFVQAGSTGKFQAFITQELESQDQLRRFMEREKNLNADIKRLQHERNSEQREFQKELQDNQAKIQEQKETLMLRAQRAEAEVAYSQKEHAAELSNQRRTNEYTQRLLANELAGLRSKIRTEAEVHKELREYLVRKEEEIRRRAEQWNIKLDKTKETLDREIARLVELKEKADAELAEYKEKYEAEERRKLERETEEKNKTLDRQNKGQYVAWKEAGGGKKKKKKK